MVNGLIGKKLGMTQVFDSNGNVVPVTIIQAGPCVVVQKKSVDKEGYPAVQLGLVELRKPPKANKPMEGHFKKSGVPPTRMLREFKERGGQDEPLRQGDNILVQDVFKVDEYVDVTGKSIGRGFQGVMRRYGAHGGRASHGSMHHRAPGSIGASASPSRVYPGMKMPGQMGSKRIKIRDLRVVKIDPENNLLLVKGGVPGSKGSYVTVTKSK